MTDVPERWVAMAADAALRAYRVIDREDPDPFGDIAYAVLAPVLTDLRRQAANLPHDPRCHLTLKSADTYTMCSCWKRDVVRLLDTGGSDD